MPGLVGISFRLHPPPLYALIARLKIPYTLAEWAMNHQWPVGEQKRLQGSLWRQKCDPPFSAHPYQLVHPLQGKGRV